MSAYLNCISRLMYVIRFQYGLIGIVQTRVFEGIATEAVNACTSALVDASKRISSKSPIDGQLFLIKHLFSLKEQISPFDISFSFTEQILDFTSMKGIYRLLGA